MKREATNITKEEWIIRLMQGMVGDYGNQRNTAKVYYSNGQFIIHHSDDEGARYFDMNNANPATDFWITNEKGVPHKELNIINIKG